MTKQPEQAILLKRDGYTLVLSKKAARLLSSEEIDEQFESMKRSLMPLD